MSDIGKIEQLTSTHAHPLTASTRWYIAPQTISLAEHDRTLNRLLTEIAALKVERAQSVKVLSDFRDAPLSLASVQPLFQLLDDLLDGPKETPCLPPAPSVL